MVLVTLLVAASAFAGHVTSTPNGYRLTENFPWLGNHAATVGAANPDGPGTTVWWDANTWDVRGDSSFISTFGNPGYHVDIHRAASPDPDDAEIANATVIGGNGDPGIGIMQLDFQGILDARLRNPILISPTRTATVDFWATRFMTTAHWWEIALTPATRVVNGDYTAVPSVNDALGDPLPPFTSPTPGPGKRPSVDSINLIATGFPDQPCTYGWYVRFGVKKSIGGNVSEFITQHQSLSELLPTDPADIDELYHWQMAIDPNQIRLYLGDDNGVMHLIETFNVTTPWPEAYVHLLGVAYEADHHPAPPSCWQVTGQQRELAWRDIVVEPVKYASTAVVPDATARADGFLSFDLRDIQRFGPPVNGAPQPNTHGYDTYGSLGYCHSPSNEFDFFCPSPTSAVDLHFNLPAGPVPQRSQFVYDIRAVNGNGTESVRLKVNGQDLGFLPPASTIAGLNGAEWAHLSLDIPPAVLQTGTNSIHLDLAGHVQLDRMNVDLASGTAAAPVAPTVLSITRAGANPSSAASVQFTVTFSTAVTGVDASDFTLVPTGTVSPSITSVTGTGATRTVTVATGGGAGTIQLNVADDDTIVDGGNTSLGGSGGGNGSAAGELFTITAVAPPSPTEVPALDPRVLVLLGVILGVAGLLTVRR
jgi:hypothetical protein